MVGNANSGKAKVKVWRDAINWALNLPTNKDLPLGKTYLQKLAIAHIKAGLTGDTQATKDIGDRLDGKPPQALIGGDDDDAPVKIDMIRRVIIGE
jgi:hypothetical protein